MITSRVISDTEFDIIGVISCGVSTCSHRVCHTMIHLRFKQHLSHWFHVPSPEFPMLPNMANDPSHANFDIVPQTSDTHTLQCVLCYVSQGQLYRGDEAVLAALGGHQQKTEAPNVAQLSSRSCSCRCGRRRKRACRRKSPAARTGRVTRLPRRCPSSS